MIPTIAHESEALAGLVTITGRQFRDGRWRKVDDLVTEECSLTVWWEDIPTGSTGEEALRTWPHDLSTFAAGHVLLDKADGPRNVAVTCVDARVFSVTLGPARAPDQAAVSGPALAPAVLLEGMRAFINAPGRWESTGCFHRAGIFDSHNETLLYVAEDIGRHNCLDRLAGWAALRTVPLADKVLLVTARLTGSLCAKALKAGFRVLASRSAITSNALAQAREAGAALAGFARPEENRFTLFMDDRNRMAHFPPENETP